ncbi:MAG: tetratricopeptide repeat protein [Armatimonadota bacterium]
MRSIDRRVWRMLLAVAITASVHGSAQADGIGVMLAPAGEQISEEEALYAEGIVAGLVAEGRRVVFLHEGSPLVRTHGVRLPAVTSSDDWTPLTSTLDSLATRMGLDYVLLTALNADGQQVRGEGLLVVRGGDGTHVRSEPCVEGRDAAEGVAERVMSAMQGLPEPSDRADEVVPLAPLDGRDEVSPDDVPTAAPPVTDDAPVAEDDPAPDRGEPALAIADEPAPTSEREDEGAPPAAASSPAPVDDALIEAEAAYEEGHLDDAEALLNASLRESGPSARAYYLRARLSLARRDRDSAIADLKRAAAMDEELVDARVWLGRLLSEQGLWQAAQQHYELAVEVDPTHLEALLGLARLYRDHGHRRTAIELLTTAVDLGQDAPSVLMLLAELHGGDGNVALAERYFQRAAAAATGEQRAIAWERLGDLYLGLHRHREALTSYLKAAELNPSRASMAERRYTEVMAAADGAVREALTVTWSAFEDFAKSGTGEREMVFRQLSEMHEQLNEAMRFAESINPPGDLCERHEDRQFAYSLAVEASVLALSWLDIGDGSMLERADEVHADAVTQFERLSEETRD